MDLGRYGSREILKLQVYNVLNKPIMYFDYANTATYEGTSSRVFAWGAGQRRIAFDGEKEYTLVVETQVFTMEHLAMLTGESIVKGAKDIYKVEEPIVGVGGTIELSKTPIGGASGVSVYNLKNGVIDHTSPLAIDTVESNTVTLNADADFVVGETVQVYYQYSTPKANTISYTAKGFPPYVKLVGDSLLADEVAQVMVAQQMIFYKAKLQPNFSISMSSQGDPATLTLTFDLFPVNVDGVDTIADQIVYED